jgi:hypothetical protein
MALILEDGSGKTNSQTYVLGTDVAAYARLYGLAPPVSADADIMKAMRYIEGAYYERWIRFNYFDLEQRGNSRYLDR